MRSGSTNAAALNTPVLSGLLSRRTSSTERPDAAASISANWEYTAVVAAASRTCSECLHSLNTRAATEASADLVTVAFMCEPTVVMPPFPVLTYLWQANLWLAVNNKQQSSNYTARKDLRHKTENGWREVLVKARVPTHKKCTLAAGKNALVAVLNTKTQGRVLQTNRPVWIPTNGQGFMLKAPDRAWHVRHQPVKVDGWVPRKHGRVEHHLTDVELTAV